MNKPTLLICSCINVFAPSKLTNPQLRREQYQNSLIYFINNTDIAKIIIVENTNCSWLTLEIQLLAEKKGKILEELIFEGEKKMADLHSIGYSHFEMVNHAFTYSRLLTKNDSLLVMDGRHLITNINLIYKHLKNGNCAFIPEVHRLKKNNLCDIRLYMVSKNVFIKHIWPLRYQLSLERSGWAESILDSILKKKTFEFTSLYTLPRIIGIQGSTGVSWDGNNYFNYHLKRILTSLLGLLQY